MCSSLEQAMKASGGNATFNKIHKAGNCEMRMLHIQKGKKKDNKKPTPQKHL